MIFWIFYLPTTKFLNILCASQLLYMAIYPEQPGGPFFIAHVEKKHLGLLRSRRSVLRTGTASKHKDLVEYVVGMSPPLAWACGGCVFFPWFARLNEKKGSFLFFVKQHIHTYMYIYYICCLEILTLNIFFWIFLKDFTSA